MRSDTALETVARHLDHLIGRLGEDGVGFGSDFDGAIVPEDARRRRRPAAADRGAAGATVSATR